MSRTTSRSPENTKKVLVYLFGSLGDSIVAIPALRAVRRHFNEAEIVMLQNLGAGGVVVASEVIPEGLVDRYLSYKSSSGRLGKLFEFFLLWRQLRRERFDAAAYLIMSERHEAAVVRDRRFFRACGIRDLYGFHPIPEAELYPFGANGRAAASDHEAVFKLKRLARDGIEYMPAPDLDTPLIRSNAAEIRDVDSWLSSKRKTPELPLVSISPGCKQQVNEWPLEHFEELGRRLMGEFPCELVIVGGQAEFAAGEQLISSWGRGINAAGAFSVRHSAALLSRCRFHIGLDTGTTHLAAAVGTRCFGIFGERNNPGLWHPLGMGHTVVHHPVACGPCRSIECAVPGHPCMNDMGVDIVWRKLAEFVREMDPNRGVKVFAI